MIDSASAPNDRPAPSSPAVPIRNAGEPIKLANLPIGGFAARSALPGELLTRARLTSDQPEFHPIADSLTDVIVAARWFRREVFTKREQILGSGIEAFKRRDSVACLKILLTEIEGILRDAHIVKIGKSAKILDLLDFAIAQGAKKNSRPRNTVFPSAIRSISS